MKGILRGRNNINRFEIDGLKFVHMGDIGCDLTDTQLDEIKGCDVLMIPVGGFFTINARQAYEMINLIEPRAVIPMHYRGDSFGYAQIGRREDFAKLFEDSGRKMISAGSVLETLPGEKAVILMEPLRKM
jgi:L-ascorbate metabolism protein UlaG (beta-lactamase superfamily)